MHFIGAKRRQKRRTVNLGGIAFAFITSTYRTQKLPLEKSTFPGNPIYVIIAISFALLQKRNLQRIHQIFAANINLKVDAMPWTAPTL